MTDFVLSDEWSALTESNFINVIEYAKLLKTPLKLGMFVPCDEKGNVLEEPDLNNTKYDINISEVETDIDYQLYDYDNLEYQQAKEKCLFEWQDGFDYKGICEMFTDLEDIIHFEFELTPLADKLLEAGI